MSFSLELALVLFKISGECFQRGMKCFCPLGTWQYKGLKQSVNGSLLSFKLGTCKSLLEIRSKVIALP